jgi:hypothetical protein
VTKHDFWRYLGERLDKQIVPHTIRKVDGLTVVTVNGFPAPLDLRKDHDGMLVRIREQSWRIGKVRNPSSLPWDEITNALVQSVAGLEPV